MNPITAACSFELNGARLAGKLGNDPFEGTFQNGQIEGTVKPNPGTTSFSHLESR